LQTPLLTGRLEGAHPFKWDGKDANLPTSLKNTVGRLGGAGISSRDVQDVQAFVTRLARPQTPTVTNAASVARGREIFASSETGCADCHTGSLMTDQGLHDLAPELGRVDTPSLVGLAHSAPYYHDGSARTLRSLVMENASVHGMGRTEHLDGKQIGDLVAYLETL
jgi:mono/diheme cytochrome c family protein